MEGQPVISVAAGPQPSSVSLSDGTANRQPHPQAIPLGREERIEELLDVILRSANTRILYADEDAGAIVPLNTLARDDQTARSVIEPDQARGGVRVDGGERLIYFMGQRCGQLADGGEPRDVRQSLLGLLQSL